MKYRKMLCGVVGTLTICFMLTGCHIKHEWQEATCAAPKTCTVGGETVGEALDHIWLVETCTEPKTCSLCGETEGEALGHTLTDANYQQAPTCTVCGETVGEPLQADFDEYGLICDTELNKIYDCVTMCHDDEEKTTNFKAVFLNYQVFDSDDTHPAKEGYEWKSVDVTILCYDENAYYYGWNVGECFEDYYDIVGHDKSLEWDDGVGHFTANYNGEDYTECQAVEEAIEKMHSDGEYSSIRAWRVLYQVPKGFDGCVYGLRNAQIEWGDGQHINDLDNSDTLFFRFSNLDDIKEYSETDVSKINLPVELASEVIGQFYNYLTVYFDEETFKFFDFDENETIDVEESTYFWAWALSNYTETPSSIPNEDAILIASDYLTGQLKVPDSLFKVSDTSFRQAAE